MPVIYNPNDPYYGNVRIDSNVTVVEHLCFDK